MFPVITVPALIVPMATERSPDAITTSLCMVAAPSSHVDTSRARDSSSRSSFLSRSRRISSESGDEGSSRISPSASSSSLGQIFVHNRFRPVQRSDPSFSWAPVTTLVRPVVSAGINGAIAADAVAANDAGSNMLPPEWVPCVENTTRFTGWRWIPLWRLSRMQRLGQAAASPGAAVADRSWSAETRRLEGGGEPRRTRESCRVERAGIRGAASPVPRPPSGSPGGLRG